MSARYESESDRVEQRRIAELLRVHRFGGDWVEMPRLHPHDFDVSRDGVLRAIFEIKKRRSKPGAPSYQTIFMDEAKYDHLMSHGAIPIYGIELDGVVMWSHLAGIEGRLQRVKGGRTDRQEAEDIDRLVLIPRASFRILHVASAPTGTDHRPRRAVHA